MDEQFDDVGSVHWLADGSLVCLSQSSRLFLPAFSSVQYLETQRQSLNAESNYLTN